MTVSMWRSTLNLDLNHSATEGDGECLGAIIGAQSAHNVLHVRLYRLLGDEELLRDITVAIAVH